MIFTLGARFGGPQFPWSEFQMTEDEARTKWCPFARAAEPQRFGDNGPMAPVAAVNRGSDALRDPSWSPNVLCIASACMAWRFNPAEIEQRWVREGVDPDPSREDGWQISTATKGPGFTTRLWWRPVKSPAGYCGLAGVQK